MSETNWFNHVVINGHKFLETINGYQCAYCFAPQDTSPKFIKDAEGFIIGLSKDILDEHTEECVYYEKPIYGKDPFERIK